VTPSDFYQLRAVECFTLAEQISDPQERVVMHELALCWLRLLARVNETLTDQGSRHSLRASPAAADVRTASPSPS
jgi:hypothetical protein